MLQYLRCVAPEHENLQGAITGFNRYNWKPVDQRPRGRHVVHAAYYIVLCMYALICAQEAAAIKGLTLRVLAHLQPDGQFHCKFCTRAGYCTLSDPSGSGTRRPP